MQKISTKDYNRMIPFWAKVQGVPRDHKSLDVLYIRDERVYPFAICPMSLTHFIVRESNKANSWCAFSVDWKGQCMELVSVSNDLRNLARNLVYDMKKWSYIKIDREISVKVVEPRMVRKI